MTPTADHLSAPGVFAACARKLAIVPFWLLAPIAHSAPDPFELSPEELFGATVMSATKTSETWWRTPAAVYVVTAEEIRRSGATSIPEALRFVPGLHVARINAGEWAITSRGFSGALSNKLLVLIDGRLVYNQLASGVYWDIQDTPLDDVRAIEVIRGPGATLWGVNAVNGVINILTRSAEETRGTLLRTRLGDEEAGAVARHGFALGERADLRVFGKYLLRDDQRAIGGGGGEDDWTVARGGFRSDWRDRDETTEYTLQGDVYRSRLDERIRRPLLVPPFNETPKSRIRSHGANLLGRMSTVIGDTGRLQVQGYLDYTVRNEQLLDDEFYAADLEVQYAFVPREWLEVVTGASFRYSISDISGSSGVVFRHARRKDDTATAFLQARAEVVPDVLALTLGSKIGHNDYSGAEVQPNARVEWYLGERQMFWASVSRAVRVPSRLEHDVAAPLASVPAEPPDLPALFVLEASPSFSSERVVAYEVGGRYEWSASLHLDVATFYNDYENLRTIIGGAPVVEDDGVDPPFIRLPIRLGNSTRGNTRGVEVAAEWRASRALQLRLSYSYLDIELSSSTPQAIIAERDERTSPAERLSVRMLWDVNASTQLDAVVHYVDELPAFDVDSHWRLDLRLSRRIGSSLEVALVAQDLFTDANREFSARDAAGATEIERTFYLQASWRY